MKEIKQNNSQKNVSQEELDLLTNRPCCNSKEFDIYNSDPLKGSSSVPSRRGFLTRRGERFLEQHGYI